MTVYSVSYFFHRHLLWFLISAYIIAVILPEFGLWIRHISFGEIVLLQKTTDVSLLTIMLAMLMFNAGLGLKISQLKNILHIKYALLTGLVANLFVPIVYIFCISIIMRIFWHNPIETQHIIVGLTLVAAMPIAGSSTAWAQNANGNLVLSLGLVFLSTIFSPIVTPGVFYIFGEMASNEYKLVLQNLAAYGSATFLGLWVVLPSLLGIVMNLIISDGWHIRSLPYMKFINCIVLLLLNYSNAAASLPQAVANRDYDFLAITLVITAGLCSILFTTAYILSRIIKLNLADRISLMFGLGMNNNGTGLVLASVVLSSYPDIMVPIIFYNLVQHIAAGTLREMMNRRATKTLELLKPASDAR
ncbi:MAG: Na+-dependent transporter [Nitrosomonadales bacterium]|nr:MAG: Na+-dependent transporter [Nitrosomonadales bacterium]